MGLGRCFAQQLPVLACLKSSEFRGVLIDKVSELMKECRSLGTREPRPRPRERIPRRDDGAVNVSRAGIDERRHRYAAERILRLEDTPAGSHLPIARDEDTVRVSGDRRSPTPQLCSSEHRGKIGGFH